MATVPQISLREIYRVPVLFKKPNGKIKRMGRVDDVLFALDEPRAMGFSVRRRWPASLFGPRFSHRFVARDALAPAFDDEERKVFTLVPGAKRGRPPADAPRDFSWGRTVIFYGLPVYTTDMERLGKVSDALIRWKDGTLAGLEVSAGVASDATLGKRTLPASYVLRFIEAQQEEVPHVLMVDAAAKTCGYAGGLASVAGKVSGKMNIAAEKAAAQAGAAAGHVANAAKAVRESDTAKAARKHVKGMWEGFSEGYAQGRHETDDAS